MKNLLVLAFLFCCVPSLISCSDNRKIAIDDHMIIYQAGGFAGAAYPPFYLLTGSSLKADTASGLRPLPVVLSKLNFNYQLPDAKFDLVKNLMASIPAELFDNNNKDFGTMPGNDMTGTVLQAHINGTDYTWSFELDQSSSSPAVVQFYNQLILVFKP